MTGPGLKARYYRLAQARREPLGQGEAAKEQRGVKRVAGECVPEERHAGEVARCEASAGARVAVQKGPDAEIGDQEKLQSAEESSGGDAWHGALFRGWWGGGLGSQCGLSLHPQGHALRSSRSEERPVGKEGRSPWAPYH